MGRAGLWPETVLCTCDPLLSAQGVRNVSNHAHMNGVAQAGGRVRFLGWDNLGGLSGRGEHCRSREGKSPAQ